MPIASHSGQKSGATSGLGPAPEDLVEPGVPESELSGIAEQVETQSVHDICESDAGVRIGESERAAGQ